jgi:hypothetical protein
MTDSATLIPLDNVDPALSKRCSIARSSRSAQTRTAYKVREGTDWLPASASPRSSENMLVGTIQCWPVALTDPAGRAPDDHGRAGRGAARAQGAAMARR